MALASRMSDRTARGARARTGPVVLSRSDAQVGRPGPEYTPFAYLVPTIATTSKAAVPDAVESTTLAAKDAPLLRRNAVDAVPVTQPSLH
eukprot:scaffold57282_cov42-Phaeocystis_antarctica.AAC.1